MQLSFIKHFFIQNKNKKRDCLLGSSISKTALIISFPVLQRQEGLQVCKLF